MRTMEDPVSSRVYVGLFNASNCLLVISLIRGFYINHTALGRYQKLNKYRSAKSLFVSLFFFFLFFSCEKGKWKIVKKKLKTCLSTICKCNKTDDVASRSGFMCAFFFFLFTCRKDETRRRFSLFCPFNFFSLCLSLSLYVHRSYDATSA